MSDRTNVDAVNKDFQKLQSKVRRILDMRVGSLREAIKGFEQMEELLKLFQVPLSRSERGRQMVADMRTTIQELAPRVQKEILKMEADALSSTLKSTVDAVLGQTSALSPLQLDVDLPATYIEAQELANTLQDQKYDGHKGTEEALQRFSDMQDTVRRSIKRTLYQVDPGRQSPRGQPRSPPSFGASGRPGTADASVFVSPRPPTSPGVSSRGSKSPLRVHISRTDSLLDRLIPLGSPQSAREIPLKSSLSPDVSVFGDGTVFDNVPPSPTRSGFMGPQLGQPLSPVGITRQHDSDFTTTVKSYNPVSGQFVTSPMTRKAITMPPLLDSSRMTQIAANTMASVSQQPVDRIASYLSPSVLNVTFETLNSDTPVPTAALPFSDWRAEDFSDEDLQRFQERYYYYLQNVPAESLLPPFPDEHFANSLTLVPDRAALVSEDFVSDLVSDMATGMRETYVYAIRKSILNYVLLNPDEQRRLGILVPPEEFRYVLFSKDWSPSFPFSNVSSSLNSSLSLLDSCATQILASLENTLVPEHFSLFLESKELLRKYPIQVSVFTRLQKEHVHSVVQRIEENVLPALKGILKDRLSNLRSSLSSPVRRNRLPPQGFAPVVGQSVFASVTSVSPFAHGNSLTDVSNDEFQRHLVASCSAMLYRKLRDVMELSLNAWKNHLSTLSSVFAVSLVLSSANSHASPTLELLPNPRAFISELISSFENSCASLNVAAGSLLSEFLPQKADVLMSGLRPGVGSSSNSVSRSLSVPVGDRDDDVVSAGREFLSSCLERDFRDAIGNISIFSPFLWLVDDSAENRIRSFLDSDKGRLLDFESFEAEVAAFREVADHCITDLPNVIQVGLFVIDCSGVRKTLQNAASAYAVRILDFMANASQTLANQICHSFEDIETAITRNPKTAEDFVSIQDYFRKIKVLLDDRDKEIKLLKSRLRFILRMDHLLNDSQISSTALAICWPDRLKPILEEAERRMESYRERFDSQLEEKLSRFEQELTSLKNQAEALRSFGDWRDHAIRVRELEMLYSALSDAEQKIPYFNEQELLLNRMKSPFLQIGEARKAADPYAKVWKLANEAFVKHDLWMNGDYTKFLFEDVDRDANQLWRDAVKMLKGLGEMPQATKVIEHVRETYDSFKKVLPVLAIFCNPGMRDRHWNMVSEVLRVRVHPSEQPSLAVVLKLDVVQYLEKLEEVGMFASKEYMLEKTLDSMESEWKPMQFNTTVWRESGTSILSGVDEIQQLLDDHIVKTQTMRSSPFIGPFEERVKKWEAKLVMLQDILDSWLKVQSSWLYLESIFSSADIQKQMPTEDKMFKTVDKVWRDTMGSVKRDPSVLSIVERDGLLSKLQECNSLLDQIQSGLNQYLETKRLFFPRFFFLSNDELLEILSETKDPLRIQPHLKKCFEGIHRLEFQKNMDITAMISSEKEMVKFDRTINPAFAEGAVEKWLVEVEKVMKSSLTKITVDSVEDFAKSAHHEWVLRWPGQIVLCTDQIYWTSETTEALETGLGSKALNAYVERLQKRLSKILELVRGELSAQNRETLGALVVISVHAKDVIVDMAEKGVSTVSDFEWQSQLRYYMEGGVVKVRMINAGLDYGYEYLGNTGRLVITPLTDRCYRTLMGALHLNLGGAPEGPAGTGKTETTKDLAKAIAKQCVVFNCSDGLDYIAMGKFFKGLASAGAWACFDEFNRIDLEVLSVVAQQILTIQRARAANAKNFVFEGSQLTLDRSCSVFITMNPGYAGRSELPDNLKALFRPVAMMVPNYAMIGEISLYSYGFLNARPLANKIVAVYKLCSEQLSSQDHYDYGMRAVKAVLTAAGQLKRRYLEENEDVLILRSIVDVNLPKFLSHDIPLFRGITSDLFPGIKLPEPDYEDLKNAVNANITKLGLQSVPAFLEKIMQLYDVICVRHGLMLVGYSFAGKTAAYKVLAGALGDLCDSGSKLKEQHTQVHVINPKSITMGQLYGRFDPISHEWSDGVLANTFRACATDPSPDRKWIMFDGPVDAVWIENMNTVLDDNKKLCLMSGEIMQMSSTMNMIFEVQDLAVASPATVSRCGMVYMEPVSMGWQPLYRSWLQVRLAQHLRTKIILDVLENLALWLIPPTLSFLRKECNEPAPTADINLVNSLTNIVEALLVDDLSSNERVEKMPERELTTRLESSFVFAFVWSLGGCCDTASRPKFDAFLRRVLNSDTPDPYGNLSTSLPRMLQMKLPAKETLFDYVFDPAKLEWVRWADRLPAEVQIPSDASFSEILVPTVDMARYSFLLQLLIRHQKPVMFCGPTGTGKSVYIKDVLLSKLDQNQFVPMFVNFSAQTSANQVQNIIDGKLDKRRKGIFGPPLGKRSVIFVDDVNMPAKEVYGAQPPVELLRQYLDHGGWYDLTDNSFRSVIDTMFVCAMGPPGGGRNDVTPRFMRHFNLLSITEFDDAVMSRIFSEILNWFFRTRQFQGSVASCTQSIVAATLDVFKTSISQLLPTPSKSHYLFNLRDFGRVVQGILLSSSRHVTDKVGVVRLWCHEVLRVFGDRLVAEDDSEWLVSHLKGCLTNFFRDDMDAVFADLLEKRKLQTGGENVSSTDADTLRQLLFGDYLDPNAGDRRTYREVNDVKRLFRVMEGYLEDFNQISKKPMNLVLFPFAIEHVSRICRILRQPGGHALLVGVGGSGRQSLTRLAAHISDFEVVQVEITSTYGNLEWREDLKKLLTRAGAQGQQTVFLFTDSQIKKETFLEDINNLLNTGEVPNLFASDEKAVIVESTRAACKNEGKTIDGSPTYLFNVFVERCRRNLHVVLCMSPVGDAFRNRLRMFPSLVNCCTIDWFRRWPEDALEAVAMKFMEETDVPKQDRKKVVDMCKKMHQSVVHLSDKFRTQDGRFNYVTPTSYLGLITSYKELLGKKRSEITAVKDRYENGLDKLNSTSKQVKKMQQELEALKPKLIKAGAETEELMKKIDREAVEVNKTKDIVMRDEAAANEKAMAAKAIKEDCEADLSKAIPIMKGALAALDTLTSNDISLVKSMKNPPPGVKVVMSAVCIMKDIKPEKKNDAATGKKVEDYWGPSMKLLGDTGFLQSLKVYDKDNVNPAIEMKIKKEFLDNPEFDPDKVRNASSAAEGLCKWVRAVVQYSDVMKIVKPKQAALGEAEAEYSSVMEALNAKRAELRAVEEKMAKLQTQLEETQGKKVQLEKEVDDCTVKLDRAQKLIGGLGGERDRWSQSARELDRRIRNLTGDILIAAGVIAYLGAFTVPYRSDCVSQWIALAQSLEIPRSEAFSLAEVLGDQVKMRAWYIDGLPKDSFSTDNGIITSTARRWPLLIDPEGQANKWIRNMERSSKMITIRLSDSNFLRTLENAVRFGTPVLLENVGEELDPSLEPLLLKQTFKQGGVPCIRLGDATVEFSADFRLYITTKLRNPHYLPELSTKVTLINFMITPEGLEDQLLGTVVAQERPDLEDEKNDLIIQSAANKKQLKEIEDKILEVLSTASNILEDSSGIEVLSASKELSIKIEKKQQIAEQTEAKIDAARIRYQPVALRSSLLFFCIASLSNIDPMYQYSLTWYQNLFLQSIANAERSSDLDVRLANLNAHFTYSLYCNVCRSLFEKDKLLFSFLLTIAIMDRESKDLNAFELRFLLTGGVSLGENTRANPAPAWLSQRSWDEICRLTDQAPQPFSDFATSVERNVSSWQEWYDLALPHEHPLPDGWSQRISPFQLLLIVRCLRPDKVVPAVFSFVSGKTGAQFVSPPGFDLPSTFADSTVRSPLIFVLSPGSDPMNELLKFADSMRMSDKLESISLGQGQGPIAERLIQNAMRIGGWVVLQNCHLATSWMSTLERICEAISPDTTHQNFRLWLTSYPSDKFPLSVLQDGVKMTNEPPKGLRANLLRSYNSDPINDPNFYESCQREMEWHRLAFGLCFFHAIVQERRKFGAIGFNIPYEFNETDLRISVRQLHMFLNESLTQGNHEVPFAALLYLTGECNYGGRVTDDWDRRCMMSILRMVYTPKIISDPKYRFSESGTYVVPAWDPASSTSSRDAAILPIESLPAIALPEVFGMHENADITKNINDTSALFASVLTAQSGARKGGGSSEQDRVVDEVATSILAKLPAPFDGELAQQKFPVSYNESMNTVFCQELIRFNKLTTVIRSTLNQIRKAIKGLVVMSSDLEKVGISLYNGQVPSAWASKSYPSRKPLAGYVADLLMRLEMLQSWFNSGPPTILWVSGFFFTQACLTGILQNFARKYTIPVDILEFDFEFIDGPVPTSKPTDGAYIRGMFFECARWNSETHVLDESQPKVLFSECPIIWLKPAESAKIPKRPHYRCPVYKESARRGVLSTTGHSTNFVIAIRVPSDKPEDHWVRRGVALLLQLDD
eukprot:ANDGO_02454.mRNA.1 Dynein-1-beta heavy chain